MSELGEQLAAALVDRYRIKREIGRGGMATVYLAEDLKHQREVAVKVLLPELAATLGADRFLQEIRVTANLQHPHVLPLYDSGRAVWRCGSMADGLDGGPTAQGDEPTALPPYRRTADFLYYVMPYVSGESLRDRLKRERQLPIDEALRLTEQIASALDYAHRQGVIHRDIKPENILLQEGVPLVADFGIALAVSAAGGERLTETGLSVGTPAYMSPEQAAGDRELDARSDIYSLACALYEMLAGDPPFTGSTAQAVLARHVTDPVPAISTVRSSVPAGAVAALNKALAKAPADRFQTAKAFAEGLHDDVAAAESETKSIVVLPFANLSPDPENEYFADGLTEEIITDLSQVRSLMVISRNSAMQLKGTKKDTKTIGRELGVRYVLEGTVRRAGNRLRITAQLIDAERDVHLWADKFTGTLDDVFELQESVSRSIVDALEVELSPEERQKIAEHAASGSVEAYDLYLLGRHHMNRLTKEGLRTAVDHFQRAVELQPDFAKAYAGLADSYMLLTQGSGEPPLEYFPKAREATLRALEIDPLLEEAHTSLGGVYLFFDWDWAGAERELRRAIELNPNYGQAHHWLAISLFARARHREALEAMRRALALDPLSPYVNLNVGWLHYGARDYDGALAHMLSVIATHANSPGVRAMLGQAYMAKGMFDEAITELEKALELGQGQFIMPLLMLGYTLARAGRIDDARKLLRRMEDMEQHEFVNPDYFAIIHIGLGELEQAIDRLEQGLEARTDWPIWLPVDPMVDPIRTHPRFAALLDRIGLSELAALPAPEEAPQGRPEERSVVVLPFDNLGNDPENAFFAEGLTDEITTDLCKIPSLRVISRTSAAQIRQTAKDTRAIGRSLNVQYVLEGSVRRAGSDVRISAQLIDAARDTHVWAETYAGTLQDVFGMQEQVARSIAETLRLRLSGAHKRTTDVAAYDAYLKGCHHLNRMTHAAVRKAIEHFEHAIALDPEFAQPHAALGEARIRFAGGVGDISDPTALARAREAAEHALQLDPDLAEAHVTLGMIASQRDWNRGVARTHFQRAISSNPNLVLAHVWYAQHLLFLEMDPAAALREVEAAERLDPLNLLVKLMRGVAHQYGSPPRVDRAVEQFREIVELEPSYAFGHYWMSYAHVDLGDLDTAVAEIERAVALVEGRSLVLTGARGYVHARAGNHEVAREAIAALNRERDRGSASSSWIARVYAGLGEWDEAFRWLDEAYAEHDMSLVYCTMETEFRPVRGDPRFRNLLRRMGLKAPEVPPAQQALPTPQAGKSIVVLPFENVSPDPDNAFFADGLTEELIADLSKVQALKVISRTSAFAFKGTARTVPSIARELNVRYVLEGSVRRAGNNLRITAQLIDTETDAHLWAEKYSGTLDDVFDLQERLSRQIVHQLEVQLTTDEHRRLAARPLTDVRAHDIWLRARQAALTMTMENYDRARQLVEEALTLVGDNALLHATLGWIHMVYFSAIVERSDEIVELAQRHAARAMELDPDLAWAHFVAGVVYHRQGHTQEFLECLKRAVSIERDSHVLAVLGIHLPEMGKTAAARRYAEEARARDPLSFVTAFAAATVEVFDGRAAEVLDELRSAWMRFAHNEPWSTYELGYVALQAGHEDEAFERFRHVATTDNALYVILGRMFTAALKSDREGIFEALAEAGVEDLVRRFGFTCVPVAECLARVGAKGQALQWLDWAIERGATAHVYLAQHDRLLVPLQGNPRFQSLIERAKEKERALVV